MTNEFQPLVTGEVVGSLLEALTDRGYTKQQVRDALDSSHFDETAWWEQFGGSTLDVLAETIGLSPFPDEGTDEDKELMSVAGTDYPVCPRCGHRGGLHHSLIGCVVEQWENQCTCPLFWDGNQWSVAAKNPLELVNWKHTRDYSVLIHDAEPRFREGMRDGDVLCKQCGVQLVIDEHPDINA